MAKLPSTSSLKPSRKTLIDLQAGLTFAVVKFSQGLANAVLELEVIGRWPWQEARETNDV